MGVSRIVLVALAAFGFAVPAAQAQDGDENGFASAGAEQQRGAAKPWRNVRGFGRVLDLTKLPVDIDEPGLYAIDRNWPIPASATAANPEVIRITANDVTLDLHGFEITANNIRVPPPSTLLVITGHRTEVRNGRLAACCEGAVTVHSTGLGTRLHHLSLSSQEAIAFLGDGAALTDSEVAVREGMAFASRSSLERNSINCNRGVRCATLLGDTSLITDNTMTLFQGGGIDIAGDGNIVADNIVDVTNAVDASEAFEVAGDHNVVRGNTVLLGGITSNASAIYLISGTANTLDGNIAAPSATPHQPRTGMAFTSDGNFYGDNRMAAEVPFALGGTVQTNWGDNVSY